MRWDKITEKQNPMSENIDQQSTQEILEIINKDNTGVADAVAEALPDIQRFIDALIVRFQHGGKLFYIGSGTSGRLGVLDAAECPPTYRTEPKMVQGIIAGGYEALVRSIEGAEDIPDDGAKAVLDYGVTEKDAVLGITASSSTPFVLGSLKKAKKINALTGLLICNEPIELPYVDHLLSIIVGPEIITGSTRMKAGTATKMVLNMITTVSMIKLNKTFGNLMVDLKASNQKLWDRGARLVSHLTDLNYDDALELLKSVEGEVKTAVVMSKLNIDKKDARNQIRKQQGSLRKTLDNPENL
jgi:N-acetylmuramic acid 6-phosphate etherase